LADNSSGRDSEHCKPDDEHRKALPGTNTVKAPSNAQGVNGHAAFEGKIGGMFGKKTQTAGLSTGFHTFAFC
jgi:hypothetical protein